MVLDKEALRKGPALSFSYIELEEILEAARNDEDIRKTTISKLKTLVTFARTKQAYRMKNTTISAQ